MRGIKSASGKRDGAPELHARALLDAVTVVVSKRGSGLEAIARPAHQMNDGIWQVDGLLMPLAGEWSARVEILVGDFELIRLEGPVEIAP